MFTYITPAGNTVTTSKDISVIPDGPCCCGCYDDEHRVCPYWQTHINPADKYEARCDFTGKVDTEMLFDGLKICGVREGLV